MTQTQISKNTEKTIESKIKLSFKFPIEHIQDWNKCSLIANFFAEYQAESYPDKKAEVISILSTIINELLENAIKFSHNTAHLLKITLKKSSNSIIIETENITDNKHKNKLQKTLQDIKSTDPEKILLEKITQNHKKSQNSSEIGLLNIMTHFNGKLSMTTKQISNSNYSAIVISVQINDSIFTR